jgi:asparagine synthase (glutamine-hydrolysing)
MNYDILVRLKNGFKEANDLSELQRNEIQGVQLSHLLKYADRNSMAFSIETRLPFLDYRLVEFALSIPMGLLIHDGWTKNIVREGLKRIIPDEIRRRKDKIGFEVPQDLFIKHILENYFNDINENSLISTYFNKKWLLKDIKTISRKNPIIWKTLCLDLWFKVFFENAYNNFNQ